jgi:asparagine synthase (glutamine-hydrolysing)
MVFLLYKNAEILDQQLLEKIENIATKKGFPQKTIRQMGSYTLLTYTGSQNPLVYTDDNGELTVFGTFTYKGKCDQNSLKELATLIQSTGKLPYNDLYGNWILVYHQHNGDVIYLANDYLGLQRLYSNPTQTAYSNSLLMIAALANIKTIDTDGFYEYVFTGGFYGTRTVLQEVRGVDPKYYCLLDRSIVRKTFIEQTAVDTTVTIAQQSLANYVTTHREYFLQNGVSIGLSGGYDSRLLLAMLVAHGIKPTLYTFGKETSKDVIAAKAIATKANLAIQAIDKSPYSPKTEQEYADLVTKRFYNADGLSNLGIFADIYNSPQEPDNSVNLNGAGGEIYRNFWKLLPFPIAISALITSKYALPDHAWATSAFSYSQFVRTLAQTIKEELGISRDFLTRSEADRVYVFLRLRYWTSLLNSEMNQHRLAVIPFAEPSIFYPSFSIPLRQKLFGTFEADLINSFSPAIASCQSTYGFSFSGKRSLKSYLSDFVKICAPPFVRKFFREAVRKDKRQWGEFLNIPFIEKFLQKKEFVVANYMKLEEIKDPAVFSRCLSVEALLQEIP